MIKFMAMEKKQNKKIEKEYEKKKWEKPKSFINK